MTIELRYQPYRLFPYERELAQREVASLGLEIVRQDQTGILAEGNANHDALSRLTYFREVVWNGMLVEPSVARIERRHLQRRRADRAPRQATRYLVHGLHEYKGKFHPQMVRAFANLLGVRPGDLVLDPFAGSGTTLVEAVMMGANAAGADLSPLAVLISQAKLAVLHEPDRGRLAARLQEWGLQATGSMSQASATEAAVPMPHLGEDSVGFLRSWFSQREFAALTAGVSMLRSVEGDSSLHLLASVVLSSVLRRSSLQAPEDLRIRRRGPDSMPESMTELLAVAVSEAVEAVLESTDLGEFDTHGRCVLQDVTAPGAIRDLRGDMQRATVITSPPYATALPYIDTDRFSLVALGLHKASGLRTLEAELVGSREWSISEQRRWTDRLDTADDGLPAEVLDICRAIQKTDGSSVGFRKRAVPALLFRYFIQMDQVFRELRTALKPRERAVFIVGFLAFVAASFLLTPYLGRDFFPAEFWKRK
ncbi:MAG: DNA methyltransferase [Candidatus Limnocylindrales bacterium]